ncbi:MAG: PhoX family protein [Moraxellaceae bacterium]
MDNKPSAMVEYDADAVVNQSSNTHISDILDARLSRRQALFGGLKASAAFMLSGAAMAGLTGCGSEDDEAKTTTPPSTPTALALAFAAIPKSIDDVIHVPAGYSASVLYALGDPLDTTTSAWAHDGSETGASFEQRAGDHHDGMAYFGLGGTGKWSANESTRGLLVMNHENITRAFLHAAGASTASPRDADQALKEINCHGVSVIEVKKSATGKFELVRGSAFNRRITPFTEMELTGPVAGTDWVKTKYSTDGTKTRGTINNCANGETPWGTYLTCEENWYGYFKNANDTGLTDAEKALRARYGINSSTGSNSWSTAGVDEVYAQWDLARSGATATDDYRNRANTYGWVVEINPFDPASKPKKRTVFGRMGHENAALGKVVVGQPIVYYTGDDVTGEYLYKFVSDALWDAADASNPAAGDKYLTDGTLFVAKFNADGSGEWLPLVHGDSVTGSYSHGGFVYDFNSQADVLVGTRLAADKLGATRMDRPEWVGVNPKNGEGYLTLTNNGGRGTTFALDAANPRQYPGSGNASTGTLQGNRNGHIIRWHEDGDDVFTWDIYLFGSRAEYIPGVNLSGLNPSNDLSSPDGLWFDPRGLLWIQTDDGAYTDVTNCMMLAAVPGVVGDGEAKTTSSGISTFVGAKPGTENTDLRRFLVGPKECEITGIAMAPDGKTMFVNIQHPGENGTTASSASHWPHAADATQIGSDFTLRPRSATIVITKNDGGVIGL